MVCIFDNSSHGMSLSLFHLVLQLPKRRGEYLFGVAPCLAALQAGRRHVYNIFLKAAIGSRTGDLKRSVTKWKVKHMFTHTVNP